MAKTPHSDVNVKTVTAGQTVQPATTPTIYNVTCTVASTEYSQSLPSNCKAFTIGIRSKIATHTWQLKFSAGGTAFYFKGSESYFESNILLASQTLYFQSDYAGDIIQIIAYS
jgi:hypothetical protein